jgi:hypothetical protein
MVERGSVSSADVVASGERGTKPSDMKEQERLGSSSSSLSDDCAASSTSDRLVMGRINVGFRDNSLPGVVGPSSSSSWGTERLSILRAEVLVLGELELVVVVEEEVLVCCS